MSVRFFAAVLFVAAALASPAAAEDTKVLSRLPREFGIIEQTIAVPFKPVSAYALVESSAGEVRQYHAVAVPMGGGTTSIEAGQTVLVGAVLPVPAKAAPEGLFHFTFFLANTSGEFAATEVRSLTWKALQANALTVDAMEQEITRYEKDLPERREENMQLEARLAQLREKASKIAGVDDLIDLKSELANLKGFDEKKIAELDRLHLLVRAGEQRALPPQADDKRMELGDQLRSAAQVTAEADQLGLTKKESVEGAFRRKLELVRQAQGVNAQELAQEVLRLRKHRKELEARLGQGGETGDGAQEF